MVGGPVRQDGPDRTCTAVETPAGGSVLADRYELIEVLGRGGTAHVWLAQDRRLGRQVAIKLFSQTGEVPDQQARRKLETHIAASLSHPSLVTIYDVGVEHTAEPGADIAFLVMELVTGEPLSRRLTRGPMPTDVVRQLGADLADVLNYIHARRIVHRDIKPANVLLTETRGALRPKLADFGIARLLDDHRLTEHGLTLGTPNYLSPEQVTGDEVTPASDVYSLGLLLIECLTGSVVFAGHGIEAALARLHRDPLVPEQLPHALRDALRAATSRNAHDRPTMADLAATLRSTSQERPTTVLAALPAVAGPAAAADVVRPAGPATRRRGRVAALAAAGMGAAAIASVALIGAAHHPSSDTGAGPTSHPSSAAPVQTTQAAEPIGHASDATVRAVTSVHRSARTTHTTVDHSTRKTTRAGAAHRPTKPRPKQPGRAAHPAAGPAGAAHPAPPAAPRPKAVPRP